MQSFLKNLPIDFKLFFSLKLMLPPVSDSVL